MDSRNARPHLPLQSEFLELLQFLHYFANMASEQVLILKFPLIPPQQALSTFRVSKSELKRRTKQREAEARKAEKASKAAAAAPSRPKKEKSGEELEGDLNPNQYFEIRSRQINKLQAPTQIPNQYLTGRVRGEISGHQDRPNIERCRNPSRCKNNDQAFIWK